ncbi:MAG: amylo-alpha-1,6-glucosidase [Alphaproteobacteria bacterium]|nr:amylo-alpha-1,6-glucosidase [Alphaproteobacteria bacterium]MDE2336401.1 amylo-alpha-1,6-glucosidase [Alphaproteobacteria bacterium]
MTEPSLAELGLVTLKHGRSYALLDRGGDIAPETGLMGVYADDMRFAAALTLRLNGQTLRRGGAQFTPDNAELVVSLASPAMKDSAGTDIPANSLLVERRLTLKDGLLRQAVTVRNFGVSPVKATLGFTFGNDFVDMFNVRGQNLKKTLGAQDKAAVAGNGVFWRYKGIDGITRESGVFFDAAAGPARLTETQADFVLDLPPGGEKTIYLACGKPDGAAIGPESYAAARDAVRAERAALRAEGAQLSFSDPQLQDWFDRTQNDLAFLTTCYDSGPYPCAGVPWFAVPFGRDGIITAFETLWANPSTARGVLQFLSGRQAKKADPARDAEPGKIMHETRENEMSHAGLVPFGLYYGGVDTTLLYVVLAGEYLRRTGDTAFIRTIWPNIKAALAWMENSAAGGSRPEKNSDGFVAYRRKKETGLYNQMWKDSQDSVFDSKGNTDVSFPRAVCEVQGYAYAAWNAGKALAAVFHEAARAKRYAARAKTLRRNFNEKFWNKKGQYYVLALDGDKKPCAVRASNMGQLLFTGIMPKARAKKVVAQLMGTDSFTGFGIRTLMQGEPRYNPLSYHNGSVWPHDTALIAAGMGRAGYAREAARLFEGMFAAARANGWRLPELFGGFAREEGMAPVAYPQACSPQAWAAAAPLQLLQAVLELDVDAGRRTVAINPRNWRAAWGTVRIDRLPVGDRTADIEIADGKLKVIRAGGVKFVTPQRKNSAATRLKRG